MVAVGMGWIVAAVIGWALACAGWVRANWWRHRANQYEAVADEARRERNAASCAKETERQSASEMRSDMQAIDKLAGLILSKTGKWKA